MAETSRHATTCLIFDIDGTLVDSDGFENTLYSAAIRDVLGNVRIRADWGAYEHVTDAGIFREICRDNNVETNGAEQSVRTRFGELVSMHLRAAGRCSPIVGGISLWNSLRSDDRFTIGIATGGWGHTARMKLRAAGYSIESIPLASSDDSHERIGIMDRCRGMLSPTGATIYIGDGEWDLAAATAVGWRFVGVGSRLRDKCKNWIPDFSSSNVVDQFLSWVASRP